MTWQGKRRDLPWVTVWACIEPPDGSTFVVLRQDWNADLSVRTIYEIDLVDAEPSA